jgi:hypothetical protein
LHEGDESGLSGLDTAPFVTYFESRAPEALETPASWPEAVSGSVRFRRRMLSPKGALPVPIVASARLLDVDGDGRLEIVVCDMGHGVVLLGSPARDGSELREIAKVPSPVHAAVADLDRDGGSDLLVADVGAFLPGDHEKGAVVWLRADGKGGFEKRVLADRLPRVTDVEAADFDADGDLDLVVAASGYHVGGGLLLYENRTTDWREPRFVPTVLDERSGVVQATPADLDGDGRTDLVALIARQHQAVVAFLNRGAPAFEKRTLFTAPTPAWGSTGLELVDLDGDSDLDLLLTNGDTLEDASVKPYHGVRWLENRGSDSWARHDLAALPGAQRAVAKDLDGDSDMDVVVADVPARPRARPRRAHLARLAGADAPGRLRAPRPAEGPALPRHARPRGRGRRRRRRPRRRQLRRLHLRAHGHRIRRRGLDRALGEPAPAMTRRRDVAAGTVGLTL